MAKMMLSPKRLSKLLEPLGFVLRESDSCTKEIALVRLSSIPRLFEHLRIHGSGRRGEAVSAETAISGARGVAIDPCIAARDLRLMLALEQNPEMHYTLVETNDQAQAWEQRVASLADTYCRATADSEGRALLERLAPALHTLDRYIEMVGDMNAIFDAEYKYFQDADPSHRDAAERLAQHLWRVEPAADAELAALILLRFSKAVDGIDYALQGQCFEEAADLRARLYLLVDFVSDKRRVWRAGR